MTLRILRLPLQTVKTRLAGYENIFVVCDGRVRHIADALGIGERGRLAIDAREETKTLATVLEIERWLLEQNADRSAFLLAVGGGITTDLAGFAASIYKRGIRFGFVPTTLLAQVDAAVGGKNGVNLDGFKNMLGVIRQPEMTFLCPEVLETLPYREFVSGSAELLKSFLLDDTDGLYAKAVTLLAAIHAAPEPAAAVRTASASLQKLVATAAGIKAGIVQRDPEEHGERRKLNLGHTFAHAIEQRSGGSVPHGEAVAIGILLAARLSEKLGIAAPGLALRLETDFRRCGLPVSCPYPLPELAEAMRKDKKADGEIIHFILPRTVGDVGIYDLSLTELNLETHENA